MEKTNTKALTTNESTLLWVTKACVGCCRTFDTYQTLAGILDGQRNPDARRFGVTAKQTAQGGFLCATCAMTEGK